jgi:hypothetical protein
MHFVLFQTCFVSFVSQVLKHLECSYSCNSNIVHYILHSTVITGCTPMILNFMIWHNLTKPAKRSMIMVDHQVMLLS